MYNKEGADLLGFSHTIISWIFGGGAKSMESLLNGLLMSEISAKKQLKERKYREYQSKYITS